MIVWNKVTWYSRYLALLFFTIIFPMWAFYLGTQYQSAKTVILEPNIEFPATKDSTSTPIIEPKPTATVVEINSGITGTVSIGPTCPVERIPPDPNCADKSYSPTLIFTNTETGTTKSLKVSEDGTFKISLAPGIYTVENKSDAILPRMSDVGRIIVQANNYEDIKIEFDSGIR